MLKRVPVTLTSRLSDSTVKGRPESFATEKYASPSSFTRLLKSPNLVGYVSLDIELSITEVPSDNNTCILSPAGTSTFEYITGANNFILAVRNTSDDRASTNGTANEAATMIPRRFLFFS